MSGNFVQRGEPAFFDKWKRAEMAVRGGVDLIIELPAVFALRSAQYFAAGGIRLLHSLGIISHVCFGAEHADFEALVDTMCEQAFASGSPSNNPCVPNQAEMLALYRSLWATVASH